MGTIRIVDPDVPPAWAVDRLGGAAPGAPVCGENGVAVQTAAGERFRLVECRVARAGESPSRLEAAAAAAYREVRERLEPTVHRAPVRFWNFVPDILRSDGRGGVYYEAFNRGRFQAFASWFGRQRFASRIPAATGVGHRGDDLVILALAGKEPGEKLENPRQTPAYEYSDEFGDLPPCFARATLVREPGEEPDLLIVSGTAAVLGERSMHPGDIQGQSLETFANMARLLPSTGGSGFLDEGGPVGRDHPAGLRAALEAYTDVRVYVVKEEDVPAVEQMVLRYFPAGIRVELTQADLCREELLVEIEGIASV